MGPIPHPDRYFNAWGELSDVEYFNYLDETEVDTCWEICPPGLTPSQAWSCKWNPTGTLEEAVNRILPDYRAFGLDHEQAARLLLALKLIRGLGIDSDDLTPEKADEVNRRYLEWFERWHGPLE